MSNYSYKLLNPLGTTHFNLFIPKQNNGWHLASLPAEVSGTLGTWLT